MIVRLWRVTPSGLREGPITGEAEASHRSLRVTVDGRTVLISASTGWQLGTVRGRYGNARSGLLMDRASLRACEKLLWCDCAQPGRPVKTRRGRWVCALCAKGHREAEEK